jgi:hypothetical protein
MHCHVSNHLARDVKMSVTPRGEFFPTPRPQLAVTHADTNSAPFIEMCPPSLGYPLASSVRIWVRLAMS